jgi:phospholipid/cholesterol/gamma-HCH transport system substrate-binding protein/paraquat-inducible protein B
MEDSKRYARLGLFVVVSLFILAAALFLLGGRKWFQPKLVFETYFNQSVAGLDLGAPVKFRGVPLGQVSEIKTSAATYERDVPLEQRRGYIVVRVEVNLSAEEVERMKQDATKLVSRGLRAQTQLAGLTGQQYLSLDFLDPNKYPPLDFPWTPDYPYLPSAPNSTAEIIAKAQLFLATLDDADVLALGHNLNTLVTDLDNKLGDIPVAELSAKARDVLANVDTTLKRVDSALSAAPLDQTFRKLASVSGRLDALLGDPAVKQTLDSVAVVTARLRKIADDGDLDRVVTRLDEAAERLDVLLGDNQYDVRVIVQDLRVTTENLRSLSETLKRYPAGVLVGGPPDKLQLPGTSQ